MPEMHTVDDCGTWLPVSGLRPLEEGTGACSMTIGMMRVCVVVCLALGVGSCGNGGGGSPMAPTRPVTPVVPDVTGQWSGALHVTRVTATGGWAFGTDTCEGMTECRTSAGFEPMPATVMFMQTGRQVSGSLTFAGGDFDDVTFSLQSGTVADTGAVTLTFGPQSLRDVLPDVENGEINVSLQPTGEGSIARDGHARWYDRAAAYNGHPDRRAGNRIVSRRGRCHVRVLGVAARIVGRSRAWDPPAGMELGTLWGSAAWLRRASEAHERAEAGTPVRQAAAARHHGRHHRPRLAPAKRVV